MTLYDAERVLMQVASTDSDARLIEHLVQAALDIVHARETLVISVTEQALGWHFYSVSVARSAVRQLASLPESQISHVKGDSLEQKFVNWLNRQSKKRGLSERIHFSLASDLQSSRYGLF